MKKKCICCGEEKEIIEFCKNKNSKDGYHYYCRQCNSHNAKKWRMRNPDKTKEYNEKHSDIKRKWAEDNLERIRSKQREWDHKNRAKESKRKRVYHYQRFHNDPFFKYKTSCRSVVYRAIYRSKPYRENTKMFKLLGCSYEVLRIHLLRTWESRYGHQYTGEKFNIDHIVPLCAAKNEESIRKLCHYTNLQMLTPEDNRLKADKIHF